jgi:hypothetical protein
MNKSSSEGYQAEMGKLPITSMRMQFVLHDDDRRGYVIASIHQKNAGATVQIDLQGDDHVLFLRCVGVGGGGRHISVDIINILLKEKKEIVLLVNQDVTKDNMLLLLRKMTRIGQH